MQEEFHGAIRGRSGPGHHRHPLHGLRPPRPGGRLDVRRTYPDLPPTRLGRARCRRNLGQDTPRDWWGAGRGRHPASRDPGIGVTNQRETTVVWQDTRTRELCQHLIADGLEPTFREKTGLPVTTYFSGPKLKWLLDHVPGLREKAETGRAIFGNMDTWTSGT